MSQFVVNRNTTETLAIEAEDPKAADKIAREGGGEVISFNTTISVRPRPTQGQAGSQQSGGVQSSTVMTPSQPHG